MRSKSAPETATLVRESAPERPLAAFIQVLGAGAPRPYRLSDGACTLGSSATCDIVVPEPTVSRNHLRFELVAEGVRVQDLGSRNGTYYLGQKVVTMVLALGSKISAGAVEIVVEPDTTALRSGAIHAEQEFRGIVGASEPMRRLFATLARLEGSLVTVLLQGESGVGKEVIARAVHEGSKVKEGPLVAVNCGAIPRDLVASELFGHRRGAFTGASENRKGAFELADGGTLFLDEIGELPLDVQPMLLRALETGDIRPVGGDHERKVRVRVVAATNRDLEQEVRCGRFREDLFYRLAIVTIHVPPLRERASDIEPLARRFARAAGLTDLPEAVVFELKQRMWPGNARELRNVVQAYAALGELPRPNTSSASGLDLALGDLVDVGRPYADQKEELAERFTRIYLQALLVHTGGNQTAAAKLAKLDRTYLGRLLVKYGLTRSGD